MLITDVGSGVRKMNHMVFLNEKDVCSLLTPADAIAAAEETFLHIGLGDITVGDMAPVSYTHLDVYKRQVTCIARKRLKGRC